MVYIYTYCSTAFTFPYMHLIPALPRPAPLQLMFEMLSCASPEFDTVETIDNIIRLTREFFLADRVGLFRINKVRTCHNMTTGIISYRYFAPDHPSMRMTNARSSA